MVTKKYRRLTPEKLAEIAKKYKTKREFYDADPSAFVSASRKKIGVPDPKKEGKMIEITLLDHVCSHMFTRKFRWTKEMIANVAKEYDTRAGFAKGNKAAYSAALRQDYLDEACKHMVKDKRGTLWTLPKLHKLAKECKTPETLRATHPKAYGAAKRRELLDTIFPADVKASA